MELTPLNSDAAAEYPRACEHSWDMDHMPIFEMSRTGIVVCCRTNSIVFKTTPLNTFDADAERAENDILCTEATDSTTDVKCPPGEEATGHEAFISNLCDGQRPKPAPSQAPSVRSDLLSCCHGGHRYAGAQLRNGKPRQKSAARKHQSMPYTSLFQRMEVCGKLSQSRLVPLPGPQKLGELPLTETKRPGEHRHSSKLQNRPHRCPIRLIQYTARCNNHVFSTRSPRSTFFRPRSERPVGIACRAGAKNLDHNNGLQRGRIHPSLHQILTAPRTETLEPYKE